MHYQGYQEVDIIHKLEDEGYFPETEKWLRKRDAVRRDLILITLADANRFQAVEVDANRAYHDYLARQEAIYHRAMERSDLDVASRTSKDIAKAHGVQTDEVNRPQEDIATIMMKMKQKKLPAPRPALEVLPEEEVHSFIPVNGQAK